MSAVQVCVQRGRQVVASGVSAMLRLSVANDRHLLQSRRADTLPERLREVR